MFKHMTLLSLFLLAVLMESAIASEFGDCSDEVESKWLKDGRTMELLSDYQFVDPRMKVWLAKSGKKVDGASIPPALWTFIGPPLVGQYRDASVVHDVGCDEEQGDWRDVHSMFFEAMRCSGVSNVKARIMYAAVYHCGPRWGENQGLRLIPCADEPLRDYIRRFKVFFNENRTMPITKIASLDTEKLERIDGVSLFDRLREKGLEVTGRETLTGYTIIVPDIDEGADKIQIETTRLLTAITENLKNSPDSLVIVEGVPDVRDPGELSIALQEIRALKIEENLAAAGLEKDRITTVSYGESRENLSKFLKSGELPSKAATIRVVQIVE